MSGLKKAVLGASLALTSFAGVANAAQTIVLEKRLDQWGQEISADFAVNRELGRAWIDVVVTPTIIGEEPPEPEVIPMRVEGLYYDSARKQVLYHTAAETVVCAEDAKFLWSTSLKSTGHCSLTSAAERRKMDDGFNISEETVVKVVLEVGK